MQRGWERINNDEIREWTKGVPVRKSAIKARIAAAEALLALEDDALDLAISGSRKFASVGDLRRKMAKEIRGQRELLKVFRAATAVRRER
jgi:hypothetical protein